MNNLTNLTMHTTSSGVFDQRTNKLYSQTLLWQLFINLY